MDRLNQATEEWVALMTFVDETAGMFYEEGGIYQHEPRCKSGRGARALTLTESVAVCPRCGQRFTSTDDCTAEQNRDLHFDGDEEVPSICRFMPARRSGLLTAVRSDGSREVE